MDLLIVGRSPWFGALRAVLASGLRGLGHRVWEREGMPPFLEHEALLVIGPQDHGPPPAGGIVACVRTEQSSHPASRALDVIHGCYNTVFDIQRERARETGATWIPGWSEWSAAEFPREIDRPRGVLWYGTSTARRQEILPRIDAKVPVEMSMGFLAGEDKRVALLESKIALVVHAYDAGGSEPFRYAEAAACGALIVAEAAPDTFPWVAGEDFVQATCEQLPQVVEECLGRWPETEPMRRRAFTRWNETSKPIHAARTIEAAFEKLLCRVV